MFFCLLVWNSAMVAAIKIFDVLLGRPQTQLEDKFSRLFGRLPSPANKNGTLFSRMYVFLSTSRSVENPGLHEEDRSHNYIKSTITLHRRHFSKSVIRVTEHVVSGSNRYCPMNEGRRKLYISINTALLNPSSKACQGNLRWDPHIVYAVFQSDIIPL